jgi:signal transduction histidine kinase
MSAEEVEEVFNRELVAFSHSILDMVLNIIDGDSGSIMLLDPIEKVLRVTSYRGISPEVERLKIALGEGIAGYALKKKASLILNNGDTFMGRTLSRDDVSSSIVLPVVSGEDRIGVININRSPEKEAFSIEDLETASLFGRYFNAIVRSILAFHKNLQATKLARAHYRILRNVSRYRGVNCMMKYLLEALINLTGASSGAIGIYERGTIRIVHSIPKSLTEDLIGVLFGRVLENKREEITEDAIMFPLLYKEELLGAVYLNFGSNLPDLKEIGKIKFLLRDVGVVLKNLSCYISAKETVRREERTRITNILHDRICQGITEGILRIQYIKKFNPGHDVLAEVDELEYLLKKVLDDVRCIIYEEKPVKLEGGFFDNLRKYVEGEEKRSGIRFVTTLSGDEKILPNSVKEVLFSVLREAVANVRRHSMADSAYVECNIEEGGVRLKVRDNGVGFNYEKYKEESNSFGIKIMKDRVESLGGTFMIEGVPYKGTKVEAYVPL